jgi:hypothetical protein
MGNSTNESALFMVLVDDDEDRPSVGPINGNGHHSMTVQRRTNRTTSLLWPHTNGSAAKWRPNKGIALYHGRSHHDADADSQPRRPVPFVNVIPIIVPRNGSDRIDAPMMMRRAQLGKKKIEQNAQTQKLLWHKSHEYASECNKKGKIVFCWSI